MPGTLMTELGSAPQPSTLDDGIVTHLRKNFSLPLAGVILFSTAVAVGFFLRSPSFILVGWWVLIQIETVLRLYLGWRDTKNGVPTQVALQRFWYGAFVAACLWAALGAGIAPLSDVPSAVLLTAILGAVAGAGTLSLGICGTRATVWACIVMVPLSVRCLLHFEATIRLLGLIIVAYTILLVLIGSRRARSFKEQFERDAARVAAYGRAWEFLEEASDLIHMVNADGKLSYANRAWRDALGYQPSEVRSLRLSDIVAPEQRDHCEEVHAMLMRGEDVSAFDTTFVTRDGRRIPVSGSVGVQREGGRIVNSRGLFRDVTAQREMERAWRETQEMKDQFLASVSHELRTPLNAMLGFCEALQIAVYEPLTPSQERAVKAIEESGEHLLALIGEILDLSKIRADRLPLNKESTDLRAECAAVLPLLDAQLLRRGHRLEFDEHRESVVADVDRLRFRQILLNLVSNAIKFSPPGGNLGIELETLPGGKMVSMTVWDSGPGIAESHRSAVFEPFVRVHSSTTSTQGTGLGLPLVAQLVRIHGGSVELQSVPGEGSRFTVTFPAATAAPPETVMPIYRAVPSGSGVSTESHVAERPSVLVVDDNPANVTHLHDFLCSLGYKVFLADCGKDALGTVRAERPDVILMDIQLPDMSGLDAIHQIRSTAQREQPFIIALTALASATDEARCIKAGADKFVAKPYRLRDLDVILMERRNVEGVGLPLNLVSPPTEDTPGMESA